MGQPRPALQVVREGNPGHRPVREGIRTPPAELVEPDWEQTFPKLVVGTEPAPPETYRELLDQGLDDKAVQRIHDRYESALEAYEQSLKHRDEARRARFVARREWRRVVPVLQKTTGIGTIDTVILHDLCVIVARLDQAERDISRNGIWVPGERGAQKNPCVTAATGYRTQLKAYIGELGLSPSSRTKLTPPDGDDGDDGDDAFD